MKSYRLHFISLFVLLTIGGILPVDFRGHVFSVDLLVGSLLSSLVATAVLYVLLDVLAKMISGMVVQQLSSTPQVRHRDESGIHAPGH